MKNKRPKEISLFVDLDFSLIAADTLFESIIILLRSFPLKIFLVIIWMFGGKAYFKDKVVSYRTPRADLLPYRSEILDYIKEEKESGRNVYLLSAANQKIADQISEHLGIFNAVFGSTAHLNLTGEAKLDRIRKVVGDGEFDYIGDSKADIPIWEKANSVIMINPTRALRNQFGNNDNVQIINAARNQSRAKTFIKGLRIHQWSKNALLFLPILLAHQLTDIGTLVTVLWAIVSFSFCASAVYLLNDMLDIETDRKHPIKRYRPFASGLMKIKTGLMLILLLLTISIVISLTMLPATFLLILMIYLISTTAYSIILKQIMLIDVLVLGGLYTLRITAGSIASEVDVSSWLLVFSMFFFLSLAFMKRYADLILIKQNNQQEIAGRGYHVNDLDLTQKSGITSGFVAMLVLALYINSDRVIELYKSPILIWFMIPVLFYWLMRMWMVTNRGGMTEDPIIYAIRDKTTYIAMIIIGIIMILAATVDNTIFSNLNIVQ